MDSRHRRGDSHRHHICETDTASLVRGSHNRWIHCTGTMTFINTVSSKQPQRSSSEAATADGFAAQALRFSSKSFFRSKHNEVPSMQPQSVDSLHRAMILIEIVFPKQSHRSSFDATTIDGIIPQCNDSHRNHHCEAATAQLLRGNHIRWIHSTGAMIPTELAPSRQPSSHPGACIIRSDPSLRYIYIYNIWCIMYYI